MFRPKEERYGQLVRAIFGGEVMAVDAHLIQLLDELLAEIAQKRPRHVQAVRIRFGLDNGEARTLREVGKHLGVTRERIRQMEAMVLRMLRHPIRSRKIASIGGDL